MVRPPTPHERKIYGHVVKGTGADPNDPRDNIVFLTLYGTESPSDTERYSDHDSPNITNAVTGLRKSL